MLPWQRKHKMFWLKKLRLWHRKHILGMSKTNEILQVARVTTDK